MLLFLSSILIFLISFTYVAGFQNQNKVGTILSEAWKEKHNKTLEIIDHGRINRRSVPQEDFNRLFYEFSSDESESFERSKRSIDENDNVLINQEETTNLTIDKNLEGIALLTKGCKEIVVEPNNYRPIQFYYIDNALNESNVTRKSNGDLLYFETHFVVPSKNVENWICFRLSAIESNYEYSLFYEIYWFKDTKQVKLNVDDFKDISAPFDTDDDFIRFYIKISNDEFRFGRDVDYAPLLTFKNNGNPYPIRFLSFDVLKDGQLFYDCP